VILILTNKLAMDVVNRVISRENAPIMKSKRRQTSRKRKREKPRRHMQHGMTMKYHPQALLMMRKQICALKLQ